MADAKNEAKAQAAPTPEDVKRLELKESLDAWIEKQENSLRGLSDGSLSVEPLANRQFLVDSVRYAKQLSNQLATKIPDIMSERIKLGRSGMAIMEGGTFLHEILIKIADINAQKSQKPLGWQSEGAQDQKSRNTASTPDTSFTGRQP
jgi:hypothetical protein